MSISGILVKNLALPSVYKICFFVLVLGRTMGIGLRLRRVETLAPMESVKHFNIFRSDGAHLC
jgi:hypothetical protein